jgi:polysaccharide biosynthesis/export protein
MLYPLLFIVLLFCSCSSSFHTYKTTIGVEEFILDSYRIQQGKFSILEMEGKSFEEIPDKFLDEYKNTIQNGDILSIALFHPTQTNLSTSVANIGASIGFQVQEGVIHLPNLGAVFIENLTLEEAAQKIEALYKKSLQNVQTYISYKYRPNYKIELSGLVTQPTIPVDGKLRLFEALAQAQIPPQANLFKSYVTRNNKPLAIDLVKLLKEGDMSQNIVMRAGDKIYIADSSAATLVVLGKVKNQILLDLPNGSLPIRQAIAATGGVLCTGNKFYIQVIRGNMQSPKIYTLSWDHIMHLPTTSMLLIPGDMVYVTTNPITE